MGVGAALDIEPKPIQKVDPLLNVVKLSSGVSHSLLLTRDGDVWVFGSNYFGQAGFFPEMAGGLFESEDDTLREVIQLKEGFKEPLVDISSGDFSNLALGKSGAVYSWGAGLLGTTGNDLFNSEPCVVPVQKACKIASGNNLSAILTTDQTQLFIWGIMKNKTSVLKMSSPVKLSLPKDVVEINNIAVSTTCAALQYVDTSGENRIIVLGYKDVQESNQYPYNPIVVEKDFQKVADSLDLPVVYQSKPFQKPVDQIQLSGGYLYILSGGRVSVVDLNSGKETTVDLAEKIQSMSIGRNVAAFASGKSVYTFSGILDTKKQVPFLSLMASVFRPNESSQDKSIIPGKPLIDFVLSGSFTKVDLECDVSQICCGFDTFLCLQK